MKKATSCIGAVILTAGMAACKSTATPPIPPKAKVDLAFDVYNHTQGPIASFAKSQVEAGSQVSISISEMPNALQFTNISAAEQATGVMDRITSFGAKQQAPRRMVVDSKRVASVSGVDGKRIVVREKGTTGGLGARTAIDLLTGTATFAAPSKNTDYDIFLMNTNAGANYQLIDNWVAKGAGILSYSPNATWRREDRDGKTGPEGPIQTVMSDLNNALNYPWKKYGSLTQVASGGNFGVGYHGGMPPAYHSSVWAGLNPDYAKTDYAKLTAFFAEVFELQTQVDDIDGSSTIRVICDGVGRLNLVGRDLFAYVHVKDSKASSSASSSSKLSIGFMR